jgi:hypothetical protein
MKIYEGQLRRIVAGAVSSDTTTFTAVEIGNEVLKNLVVNRKLESFLGDGLNSSQPITLWTIWIPLRKNGLVALQVGDRKKYISPPFSLLTMIFFTLFFSLMACACFSMNGTVYWLMGGLLLAVVWLLIMPMMGYLNVPKDGIDL